MSIKYRIVKVSDDEVWPYHVQSAPDKSSFWWFEKGAETLQEAESMAEALLIPKPKRIIEVIKEY